MIRAIGKFVGPFRHLKAPQVFDSRVAIENPVLALTLDAFGRPTGFVLVGNGVTEPRFP